MTTPTVTVVVPAFNAAEWIGAALSSVVEQTYAADCLEVVVVDDGSNDETGEEARRRLTASAVAHVVLRNASSCGPSAARNRGWRAGRGEWIQFLDADDLLERTKIAVQARAAAAASASVAGLFSPWGRLVLRGERWMPDATIVSPSLDGDPLLGLLRDENFMQLGSLLFARRWLQETGGFGESYAFIEDVELLMRTIMRGGLLQSVPAPAPLSWYRQRAASLSRSDDRAFLDGCVRNARIADTYWTSRGELTSERRRLLAGLYFRAARYYAEHDASTFRGLVDDLYRVAPGFTPSEPGLLRLLTKTIGYVRAERCAVGYRRLKRAVQG